ncbi:phosphatase PAP2 family protein [Herbidospora galbida]|uniref:Phosphatase PAP2 family protein n=1 Tax=Herbidospora galbida TaxID=2575442 RepID=A0A4U3MMK2_9ACTN|nr:phosphatase PAP2 family protein [Herbidospora galbida]TKK90805.1 phosphatase PAP2 family protein [Herbidospora galbida]
MSGNRRLISIAAEVALLVFAFLLFSRLHAAAGVGVAERATANALTLQSWERALRLDIELAANQWLTRHPALVQPAIYYYRLYYVVLAGVLIWLYVRRPSVYLKARRTMLLMGALALVVFFTIPMSPPRFALPGVVDIVGSRGENLYSAFPSLHFGWSLWAAYAVWAARPRLAVLAWAFPVGMAVVVVVTGNHYVLDLVASVALLATAIGVRRWTESRWRSVRTSRPSG